MILVIIDCKTNNYYELEDVEGEEQLNEERKKETTWESLVALGKMFWLITGVGILLFGSITSFVNISIAFLVELYFSHIPIKDALKEAGHYMVIPFSIGAVIIPFFGIL